MGGRRDSYDDRRSGRRQSSRPRSRQRSPRARSKSQSFLRTAHCDRVPRRLMYQEGAAADRDQGGQSDSRFPKAPVKKKAMIAERMKKWEREERVQRDFFGWESKL